MQIPVKNQQTSKATGMHRLLPLQGLWMTEVYIKKKKNTLTISGQISVVSTDL